MNRWSQKSINLVLQSNNWKKKPKQFSNHKNIVDNGSNITEKYWSL